MRVSSKTPGTSVSDWITIHKHIVFTRVLKQQQQQHMIKHSYSPRDFYAFLKDLSKEDSRSVSEKLDVFLSAFEYEIFADLMRSNSKKSYWHSIMKSWATSIRRDAGGK